MAIVKKSGASMNIAYFLSFFESLNCPLIAVDKSNNTITIDNNVTITISIASNEQVRKWVFTQNGSSWTSEQYQNNNLIVCCGDNFVYLKITSNSNNSYTCFIYEKISNKVFMGHYYGGKLACSLDDIEITDLSTNLNYKHYNRLNYSLQIGYIDYTDEILFTASNIKTDIEDPNFITCTSVEQGQVITFDGKNYFALGSNTLVILDEE